MPTYETYSQRKRKAEQSGETDVYQYEKLSSAFRNQVVHILNDTLGRRSEAWAIIQSIMVREVGVPYLGKLMFADPDDQCRDHVLEAETEQVLDLIEIAFRMISNPRNHQGVNVLMGTQSASDAVDELNIRFKQNGIGFEFVGGMIVRVDSQYIHAEAVKPALRLLHDVAFTGASDEFLKAHAHFRSGDNKEAIVNALKAFESAMKTICEKRSWTLPRPTPTAHELIATLLNNGLIATELQNQFTGLRTMLEAGLPTVRNRTSGHGQGATPVEVPDHIAAYAMHMAAANIVMLVEAYQALPKLTKGRTRK